MSDAERLAAIEARWTSPNPPGHEATRLVLQLGPIRAADVDWLIGQAKKVERLRGLLARLEWAGTIVFDEWYDKGKCCPVPECRAEQGDPHTPDCWLAAELGKE